MLTSIRNLRTGGLLLAIGKTEEATRALTRHMRCAGIEVVPVSGPHDSVLTSDAVQAIVIDHAAQDLHEALRELKRTWERVHLTTAAPRPGIATALPEQDVHVPRGSLMHTLEPETTRIEPLPLPKAIDLGSRDGDRENGAVDEDAVRRMLDTGIIG